MKLVDEKGKLFGKINLIDCLAVVVLIAVAAFLALRVLPGSKNEAAEGQPMKLTYTATVTAATPQVYQEVLRQLEMNGGRDQLMAGGQLIGGAYITGVEAVPHMNYTVTDEGSVLAIRDEGPDARLDLNFTVEAIITDPITTQVGTQEVRVGKSHILKTAHIEFSYATITACDWG